MLKDKTIEPKFNIGRLPLSGRITFINNGNSVSSIKEVRIRRDEINIDNPYYWDKDEFKWYGVKVIIDDALEESQVYIKLIDSGIEEEGFTTTEYFYYLIRILYVGYLR